ncbi:hypothetical protein EGH22_14495 [Halomicroarcula sp. F28]|uniref:hypothetical protein n=1 Tax=Haloarcula salinisoli TaxID=2487746 RepID=UPI001C72D3D8|nr:hypothetical protein [Halomicroarcula salinisoli]MBX0287539.1 hypothetical protein [Halomicroarcula salinisoli]
MPVTHLRRFEADSDAGKTLGAISDSRVAIDIDQRTPIKDLCNKYPFTGQEVITANLSYTEPSEYSRGRQLEFEIEIRTGSNLFVLDSDVDVNLNNLLSILNENCASSGFRVYRSLTPSRQSLWDFIQMSHSIIDLTVINQRGEEESISEIDENQNSVRQYPVEDATLSFQYNGRKILVHYAQGSINIDYNSNEEREYILQLLEREVFQKEGAPV